MVFSGLRKEYICLQCRVHIGVRLLGNIPPKIVRILRNEKRCPRCNQKEKKYAVDAGHRHRRYCLDCGDTVEIKLTGDDEDE